MRNWSETIDPATIPDDVLKSEWGRRTSAKRKTFAGGPRPKPRCKCGLHTRDAAAKIGHKC